MAWAKLDDQLDDHDKFLNLSSAAIGQWTLALTYASRKMTDGFIPEKRARIQIQGRDEDYDAITAELVAAGLWEVVDGGFHIHDYLDYNPSRADIIARRAAKSEAGKKGAEARWQEDGSDMAGAIEPAMAEAMNDPWQTDAPVSRNPSPVIPFPGSPSVAPDGAAKPKEKKPRRKPQQPIPEDWDLSESDADYAEARGLRYERLNQEAEKFYNYWKGRGELRADWSATWRTWVNNWQSGFGQRAAR